MSKIVSQPGLTFDDVFLLPRFTDFEREDIKLETHFTKTIKLKIPLVSAPMDTVTESRLAIALAKLGGIGMLHRNLTIPQQVKHVAQVKAHKLLVGAAIGVSQGYQARAQALVEAGVDVLLLDSAHGHTQKMLEAIKFLKTTYPKLQVIAGNVATREGAKALSEAGADALRVGMGPGAICTTRIISGMGVPQITAIMETVAGAKPYKVPVIADGGIKYSGDMVKALAAGAQTVMMGSFFASTSEAPGNTFTLTADQIPPQFKKVITPGQTEYIFKSYRGMGSLGAMESGTAKKSEDEFHGKSYKDRVLVAEGVEGLVPVRGTVKDLVDQALGGIKSGLFYVGCKNISQLQTQAKFIQITPASLGESHPHSIVITNPGKNYT